MEVRMIDDNILLSRATDVVAADMDGEMVMISIASGKYYGMDAVSSSLWGLLENPKSISELVQVLCEEYEVEYRQCRADVLELLTYLRGEGLVKVD
jgi:hypothetical protein